MDIEVQAFRKTDPLQQQWLDHELVAGKYFYAFPPELLVSITDNVDRSKFDRELLELDEYISHVANQHEDMIGFFDGTPVFILTSTSANQT